MSRQFVTTPEYVDFGVTPALFVVENCTLTQIGTVSPGAVSMLSVGNYS